MLNIYGYFIGLTIKNMIFMQKKACDWIFWVKYGESFRQDFHHVIQEPAGS